MKMPKATQVRSSSASTLWLIQWPSTPQKWGKSYYATTYPDSRLMLLETAATRRKVASTMATKILPQIRDAIARATEASI